MKVKHKDTPDWVGTILENNYVKVVWPNGVVTREYFPNLEIVKEAENDAP